MKSKIRSSYEHTIYASYIGYIVQAIVNNLAPLLFLTFASEFSLSLDRITILTTLNFAVQLTVDLVSAKVIDHIGYRVSIMAAHVFAAAGLAGMALLPGILPDPYPGLLIAVVFYAIGGGIIEVLISPIVEACPTEKKEAAMSLLHSFYCWGQMGVVLLSTLFFRLAGISNWRILCCLWAIVPLFNIWYFSRVPIYPIIAEGTKRIPLSALLRRKMFWLLMVLMVCAGASELAMSQWASAFAESALHLSKTAGDLAGPCAFAVLMGTARAFYGKHSDTIPLKKMMFLCAVLCVASYLLASLSSNPYFGLIGCAVCGFSVGIFWPGTFSVAAWTLPGGGTAMYALMALAGDVGCSSGPTVVGMIANASGGNLKRGLFFAVFFPVLMAIGLLFVRDRKQSVQENASLPKEF